MSVSSWLGELSFRASLGEFHSVVVLCSVERGWIGSSHPSLLEAIPGYKGELVSSRAYPVWKENLPKFSVFVPLLISDLYFSFSFLMASRITVWHFVSSPPFPLCVSAFLSKSSLTQHSHLHNPLSIPHSISSPSFFPQPHSQCTA